MLTDTAIRRLKPSDKNTPNRPDKYSDGAGLQLWVRHTGAKKWVIAYRYNGKQTNLTLGDYPTISLQKARQTALEIKQKLQAGIDPKTAKPKAVLFGEIATQYHAQRDPKGKGRYAVTAGTYQRDFNQYRNDIAPHIAHLAVNAITPAMGLAIAKRIENRGAFDMANRSLAQMGAIYRYARVKGLYDGAIPTDGLRIAKGKERHFARLAFNELPKFFLELEQSGCEPLTKLAFRFICLTFVRTKELRFMQWDELDFGNGVWRIPACRMKAGRPHIVPLAPQAVAILDEIKQMNLSDEWVFFNLKSKRAVSENFLTQAIKRLGYQGKMTGHGFRGIASTQLHELGYRHEAIELQLAHDSQSKVAKAYNGARYLEYRKQMMNDWADLVSPCWRFK